MCADVAVSSIQFNSIKVNPSISKKEPDGDSPYKHAKEPTDILYQKHGYDRQSKTENISNEK